MSEEELIRRRALRRMKFLAGSLLALMALVFALAALFEPRYPGLVWLRVYAEAAMVGGIADWFAVTALFRRPLGLPIPHTAIIPSNKERIGDDLAGFVQRNFLSQEVLLPKLRQLDIAARIAAWLAEPEVAARLGERTQSIAPKILQGFDDQDLRRFLEPNLKTLLRSVKAAPLAGNILTVMVESDREQRMLDAALQLAQSLLEDYSQIVERTVELEMPWYVPRFMQHRLFKRIAFGLKGRLEAINADALHPVRRKFYDDLRELCRRLRESPEYARRGEALKHRLLGSEALRSYAQTLGADIKGRLYEALTTHALDYRNLFQAGFSSLGRQLQSDEGLKAKLNQALEDFMLDIFQRHRHEIAGFIADTVKRWDTPVIVDKIELTVGRDLQYIRLNGTLVGGLIGVLIQLFVMLTRWLPQSGLLKAIGN
jgi:uncharacterized membrane-anchored protein YjiN (DUF445 family)